MYFAIQTGPLGAHNIVITELSDSVKRGEPMSAKRTKRDSRDIYLQIVYFGRNEALLP